MITAIKQEPKEFLKSIQALFNEIEPWAIAKNLLIKHDYVTLNEEKYGIYEAETIQVFTITNDKIAELSPVGASIIGAKGRVDLIGTIDSVVLVDWDKGGPSFETTVTNGAETQKHIKPLYRDVNEPGWYWVESRKLSRAHKLDEQLFYDLLLAVSDYDCRS